MRAIVCTKYGSPGVLKLKAVQKPTPKNDQVLVQILAASASAADLDQMRGTPFIRMAGPFRPAYKILGSDIAGRVEAVGKNVRLFHPGDEVFGDLSVSGSRLVAEYVCAPERALSLMPSDVAFEQAAAVPNRRRWLCKVARQETGAARGQGPDQWGGRRCGNVCHSARQAFRG